MLFGSYGFDSRSSSGGCAGHPNQAIQTRHTLISLCQQPWYLGLLPLHETLHLVVTTNLIDGLLENDQYGNLIPSMAESWTVSKDGLTYTPIRSVQGLNGTFWREKSTRMWRLMTLWLVSSMRLIKRLKTCTWYKTLSRGLADYIWRKSSDFGTVGVKAVDDYTLYSPTNLRLTGTLKRYP